MKKTIRLQTGESTQIISRNFSSMPMEYTFTATAVSGEDPAGEIEIRGSNWIFPKQPQTHPLQRQNKVAAGYWDTFFRVTVTAHTDLEIGLPQRNRQSLRGVILLAAAVFVLSLIVVIITLL